MMNEYLPFNRWSRERIKQGRKFCTSRKRKWLKAPRVTYITPKLPWWFIRTYLWRPEGADSPEELQKIVDEIFKRKIEASEEFYVHFGQFRELWQG